MEGKWINFLFIEKSDSGKTDIFKVVNKETNVSLGGIMWYGPWRKYAFFPNPDMVFESQCLMDITNFLNELMKKWKEEKRRQKDESL